MTVLAMSDGELSRFDTLMRVERGELRVEDAAALLGLKRRQVFRLLDRLRSDGAAGLMSRKRGRPSNRRHSDAFREQIIAIVREHYHDFGPTLAREYLIERHEITVSCETLRQLMIQAGLWKDRDARRPRPYQPRYRRDCRGELIQVDGSKHWWFEDRGPQSTLLVFIDDATSELMHLRMVESESTFAYMDAMNQATIVESKHLDAALAMAKLIQEQLPPKRRNLNEPSRRSQGAHMFPDAQSPREEPVKRKRGRPPLGIRLDGGQCQSFTGPI